MPKKTQRKSRKNSGTTIPPGAVIDPKDWSPLHQQVAAYRKIKELLEGPHEVIPEALVRRTLAEQYGIKPEEVTWKQIQFEVSGLLRYYPAITLVPSGASDETAQTTPIPPNPLAAFGRPPLHSITCEQIDQLLHRKDQEHWPHIIAMRIKKHYPLDVPVPSPSPETLMSQIRWYASMLYKVEADQYEQLRSDGRYPAWLSRLSERVIGRVLTALERLDEGDPDALLLAFHGLNKQKIEQELKPFLWEIARQYEQGTAPGQVGITPTVPQTPTVATQTDTPSEESFVAQLKRLRKESGLTVDEMAAALAVESRSINRHLAGKAKPRRTHIAGYEKLFSERLKRNITLKRQ